jgi:hypothetical protein
MIFLFVLLHIAGMIDVCQYAQSLVEMGSHEPFLWVGLKPFRR